MTEFKEKEDHFEILRKIQKKPKAVKENLHKNLDLVWASLITV